MSEEFDFENYIPEDHKDIEVWHIGTIIFAESLLETEYSGNTRLNLKSIGECKIEVYTNEGSIPHFHLFNKDKTFETCICVYSNNYFAHGGKYLDKLSTKQCSILDEYLRQPSKQDKNISVWNAIRLSWEFGNQDSKFPDNRKVYIQPNYKTLSNYKNS